MKNKIFILLSGLALFFAISPLGSCRRWSDNGKIDGNWQIQTIHYTDDGETVECYDRFIAIQLELVQLKNHADASTYTGILHYKKGADDFMIEFPNRIPDAKLRTFGLVGPDAEVHIDKAGSNRLVLSTPIAVITCRRF